MVVEQAVGGRLLAGRVSAFPVSIGALQEQCRHFLQQFVAADAAVEQVERVVQLLEVSRWVSVFPFDDR